MILYLQVLGQCSSSRAHACLYGSGVSHPPQETRAPSSASACNSRNASPLFSNVEAEAELCNLHNSHSGEFPKHNPALVSLWLQTKHPLNGSWLQSELLQNSSNKWCRYQGFEGGTCRLQGTLLLFFQGLPPRLPFLLKLVVVEVLAFSSLVLCKRVGFVSHQPKNLCPLPLSVGLYPPPLS